MIVSGWPNGLGADVFHNGNKFEIWYHGGCSRMVRDDCSTGYHATHYNRVAYGEYDSFRDVARRVVLSWNLESENWKESE